MVGRVERFKEALAVDVGEAGTVVGDVDDGHARMRHVAADRDVHVLVLVVQSRVGTEVPEHLIEVAGVEHPLYARLRLADERPVGHPFLRPKARGELLDERRQVDRIRAHA